MMNDQKDPFRLTRMKVFVWGSALTLAVCGLIYLYVPPSPKDSITTQTFQESENQRMQRESSAPSEGAAQPIPEATADLANLPPAQTIFMKYCSQCHGNDGEGKTQMSRMMSIKPSNLVKGPFKYVRDKEAIATLIRKGSPTGAMPGFEREISEADAAGVAEYVLSLEKPEAK